MNSPYGAEYCLHVTCFSLTSVVKKANKIDKEMVKKVTELAPLDADPSSEEEGEEEDTDKGLLGAHLTTRLSFHTGGPRAGASLEDSEDERGATNTDDEDKDENDDQIVERVITP
jgi:hypothetical protein